MGAQANHRVEIFLHGAGETPDFGAEACFADQAEGFGVIGGDAREAGFDAADAEGIEEAGDFEFLLRIESDADGLLAVAQRRVVETHGTFARGTRADFRWRVQLAHPELIAVVGAHLAQPAFAAFLP